ncbi:hypothetical protein MKQ70_13400 [Chitinophaga sedimenti]|uniref:glycoside hydrolase family 38 C-terminal domain-containing protein n=1 Tax=Chitinophaga sedimenti TaxID=2033606 RepID=UPI00200431D0|nr:glycoside hydrolase family 38 C-terminal domain-containing protein [Chitinophaga sedimenti]MCK7555962.1 hypothetical protein [Chitinophaga sedimenti]
MRYLLDGTPWPQQALEVAWSNLLLAQHHDSWIVPYNRVRKRATWADQVRAWTGVANEVSDSLFDDTRSAQPYLRVVNTTAAPRREWVRVPFPVSPQLRITDADGTPALLSRQGDSTLWWLAQTPAMGFSTYRLQVGNAPASADHQHRVLVNGRHQFRTDLYELEIDPARGGVITSLKLLQQGGRQLVDTADTRGFNELRGYDYDAAAWRSSMDTAAVVTITSQGSNRSCVEIKGTFAGHPFTQQITLANGERRIDMQVRIDWQGQPSLGAYSQQTGYVVEDPRKAFYNDSCKLQLLFPVQLKGQRITKDAPFDVTESRLSNTFFSRWDSIRNNIILHWIDITDAGNNAGMTIFSDHTSSYVHGENYPPGLTLQYAGRALWGMQYGVDGPTVMQYAILPHAGNWQQAGISREEARWSEPLKVVRASAPAAHSFFLLQRQGWQVTAMMMDGTDVLIRLYNAAGGHREQTLQWNGAVQAAMIEELDGQRQQALKCIRRKGMTNIRFSAPPFGVRTLRLKNVQVNS